jgi:hypothetical protein
MLGYLVIKMSQFLLELMEIFPIAESKKIILLVGRLATICEVFTFRTVCTNHKNKVYYPTLNHILS